MKYRISTKIKGIARISLANLLSLFVSLLTSFLLPLFISVEDYGYWQLFVLYAGYVGFFAFGFNDGIHLNYATYSYNEKTAAKFKTFKSILLVMSVVETIVLIVFLTFVLGPHYGKYWTSVFAILNIIPVLVNGMFTYMNQATMRFKQYAWGNMIDKIVFTISMVLMIAVGCKSYLYYVAAYTISRYLVIVYHFFSSRMVFTKKGESLSQLKPEIVKNFTSGFMLMIATLLNSSIIVGSRLLIENQFGIVEFGAYSFANHTLVIASQFISAIASVFYPIMKRCGDEELPKAYQVFDETSTILSTILLASYYLAAIAIYLIYKQYSMVLGYFCFVYPLFIYQCKSNLLIINAYKVKNKPMWLVIRNLMGIGIHLAFAYVAYWVFGTVHSIAVSVLISYCIWYYLSQVMICREFKWKIEISMFYDLFITAIFIVIDIGLESILSTSYMITICTECLVYIIVVLIIAVIMRKSIKNTLRKTAHFLND